MGACCGKGSKPKDPDKTPYGAIPAEPPPTIHEPKERTKARSYDVPEITVGERTSGGKPVEHEDSRVNEASPITIQVTDPGESIANGLSANENTENAPEKPEKAVSFGTSSETPRLSDFIPPYEADKIQDTSIEKTSHSEPSSSNTTATEDTDVGQVVLHIDESSIKTPDRGCMGAASSPPPPLPEKHGGIGSSPSLPAKHGGAAPPPPLPKKHGYVTLSSSYNTGLPPPLPEKQNKLSPLLSRKEPIPPPEEIPTVSPAVAGKKQEPAIKAPEEEAIPDPHTIIENVRHKAKDGGFAELQISQKNKPVPENPTKVSIQQNREVPPLKSPISLTKTDANQNDSMAILGALKMIRNSSSGVSEIEDKEEVRQTSTKEVTTSVTGTKQKYEKIVETKISQESGEKVTSTKTTTVEKIVTQMSSSGEGSKIPVSPIRKELSLKEESSKKSPTLQEGTGGSLKLQTTAVAPLVNGGGTTESKKGQDSDQKVVEDVLNKSKETSAITNGSKVEDSVEVKELAKEINENHRASLSSLSSDESSDLEGGYVLMENKKTSVLELLPDCKAANDDIKYKHRFCPNTRLSTLRNIEKWMNRDEEQPRCMVIKAAPGMGKTSLLKEVCSKYSLQLLADHFFSHCSNNLGHSDLHQVVLSLAHSCTEKLDNYVGCLPTLEEVKQIVYYGSTEQVLDTFIYSALSSEGLGHEEDRKMLIVLDALDDCSFSDRDALFRFVNEFTQKAPKWLYLLASIRDENQLTSSLTAVSVLDLCDNAENMADMKKMMKESLSPFMDRISLDGGLTQLAKKSKGLALAASLYNRMLNGMDRQKGIALREIDIKFPTGMNGVLRKVMKDFKALLDREADASYFYNTLLGMLCFAREPIPVTFAEAIDIRNADQVWKALSVIVDTHGQKEDCKSLYHKSIAEWLLNEKLSEEFQLDGVAARNEIGRLCINWLSPMLDQMPYEDTPVFRYALKNSVSHLTDIPKQQESIGNILCSLRATQMKLEMNGVSILHVGNEYNHTHTRIGDANKEIILKDYMKKVPKLSEQLHLWYSFLADNQIELFHSPKSVYQLAANYVHRPRVQQNARVELAKQSWLEDISTGLVGNVDYKVLPGEARLVDVSPDGKTMAVVLSSSEENVQLVQYSTSTLEETSSVDITALEDRKGLCCKFLPDNANVFVGSLVKYVGRKGKIIPSDLDMKSLQVKQKFSVECCTVSTKYLATSLSTFPWGGRSVHLAVFGLKEKKAVKTLEVLNFRFGGSANFGIRCCAISPDEKQIIACVKDSNKNQLKVNVWNIGKWNIAHTLDVGGENILRCHFFESEKIIVDVKMVDSNICRSYIWPCQKSGQPSIVGREKASSVSCTFQSKVAVVSWDNRNKGQISVWKRGQAHEDANTYKFSGMQLSDQTVFCQSYAICLSKDIMQVFNISDSEVMDKAVTELDDLDIADVTFMPRSDTSILSHVAANDDECMLSIFNCDSKLDDIHVRSTKVPQQTLIQSESLVYSNVFQGINKPGKKCYTSHDGKYLIMCYGNGISLWNDQTGKLETLPFPDDIDSDQLIDMCIPSAKESILGVVYKQHNHKVILFDLRTKKELRRVGLEGDPLKAAVTDMTFIPHNGALISYHRNMEHKLVVWNQSTGAERSALSCKINFCRVSSSSDRFVLCCRKMESGHLQLRNSDATFSQKLQTPETWSFQRFDFDLEFSLDGTVLAGVQSQGHMTRIWNAGNGDILKDFTLGFIGSPSIVGMITNTHMAIYDGRILVIDIASAELLSVTPLPQPGHGRHSIAQLSVSPRGNIIAALYSDGAMIMLKCHNFSSVRMTTTLQRMKSFSGLHN